MPKSVQFKVRAVAAKNLRSELLEGLRFFAGLSPTQPIADDDTLGGIGLTTERIEYMVRPWINARFRSPKNLVVLRLGSLKQASSIADVLKKCGG